MFNNHFNKIFKSYNKNIILHKDLYEKIGKLIDQYTKNKVVLDIGNGGQTPYNLSDTKKIIIYDISEEMLKKIANDKIIKIEGDARNLNKIENNSIDVILLLFTLHHINGKNKTEAINSLIEVTSQAKEKLKNNGNLIIVEPVLSELLYFIESMFYKITYYILSLFKKDMVFIYSKKTLLKYFKKHFKDEDINIIELKLTGFADPLLGTFPGLIKIPASLMPTRMLFFQVSKNN